MELLLEYLDFPILPYWIEKRINLNIPKSNLNNNNKEFIYFSKSIKDEDE